MSPAGARQRVYRAKMAKKTAGDGKPPWKRKRPTASRKTHLTSASRAKAKGRARKAGRSYPNLVDNMRAAAEQRSRKKTSGAKKTSGGRKKTAGARKTAAGARKRSGTKKTAARKTAGRKKKTTRS